jgi:hypothetical protein
MNAGTGRAAARSQFAMALTTERNAPADAGIILLNQYFERSSTISGTS